MRRTRRQQRQQTHGTKLIVYVAIKLRRRTERRWRLERRRHADRSRCVSGCRRGRRQRQHERPTLAFALPSLRRHEIERAARAGAPGPLDSDGNCRAMRPGRRACRGGSHCLLESARKRHDLRKKELVYARLSILSTFDARDLRALFLGPNVLRTLHELSFCNVSRGFVLKPYALFTRKVFLL